MPTFICFIIGFVWPFIQGIYLSFCNFNTPKDAKWVGFSNYVKAFSDKGFQHAFWNTAAFAVVSIILINVLAFAIAYALTQKMRGANLFRTVFFMPNLIGGVVLGYIWSLIFDAILKGYSTYLTANATYGFWGLVILVAWQQIGYMMIIYIAGLQAIPEDLNEAAKIDGANGAGILFRVTIPNMMPSITICTFLTLTNSFKSNDAINLNAFALPGGDSFVGFDNYAKGMTFGNYPFMKSVGFSFFITIASVVLILLFTSMSAWYIARVDSLFARIFYYLCLFSMIVPFQMVMFTLTFTADRLKLNTPWTIPIVYLGFGAGLAIFMFVGFVKSLPLEIEEAAAIDGCGPFRTFFLVVLPMLKPTLISVGILETMWVWNDYLLPYLVLDRTKYMTIPIHVQYLKGSYGSVDLGATMAVIMLSIIPIIIVYIFCQKYIIKGVAAGAVKG
ncbi:MAG: ABC transporter permease subunit [Lachnospiraceae bacterium]|nr:ABC transporter permease subunit [Lachnospiraceae bacterium]